MAGSSVNQRRCQATGKLLFWYTGQLGARIPSLPVRCHKPFIGRTAASLKNTSIKARRPPTSLGPKEGFKGGRSEEGSSLGGLRGRSLLVPSLQFGGGEEGIFVRCLFLILGSPLDQYPLSRPGRRGPRPPRTIPTLFLSGVFFEAEEPRNSPHVGVGNSSDRATSRLEGCGPRARPGPRPAPSPGNCGVPPRPRAATAPPGRPRTSAPAPSHPVRFGRRREREANSPGRSGAPGRGGAAALQREPTNFRRRPAGIAWWPG